MKKETMTVYCCEFCSKVSRKAAGMSRHEVFCKNNPKNRCQCYSCVHYESAESPVDIVIEYAMSSDVTKKFYPNKCKQNGDFLYNATKMWPETEGALDYEGWKSMPTEASPCPDYEKYKPWLPEEGGAS